MFYPKGEFSYSGNDNDMITVMSWCSLTIYTVYCIVLFMHGHMHTMVW